MSLVSRTSQVAPQSLTLRKERQQKGGIFMLFLRCSSVFFSRFRSLVRSAPYNAYPVLLVIALLLAPWWVLFVVVRALIILFYTLRLFVTSLALCCSFVCDGKHYRNARHSAKNAYKKALTKVAVCTTLINK